MATPITAMFSTSLQILLFPLYGHLPAYSQWLAKFRAEIDVLHAQRSPALRTRDANRAADPQWYARANMIGYCAYTDRFAGTLDGVRARIPHLSESGVTYLHLLPFLKARAGENDGGFAVTDFEQVEPRLGTIADLEALISDLHASNISICVDLVLNHVADDHAWALQAKAGDAHAQGFFRLFPDRLLPDQFEKTVASVFPETAPGNFTWNKAMQRWVWTTFNPYQWDLNYENPEVFSEMALTMLRLANRGIDIFRLDSTPFLWKALNTTCLNLPQTHQLLQAFRCVLEHAAPATVLKSEAIVPAAQAVVYFGDPARGEKECHLAYHSALMASAWAAIAEQDTSLLRMVAAQTPAHGADNAWVTYVRCHDDIVWSVLRPQIEAQGLDFNVRMKPIADFFAGIGLLSFAQGAPFQSSDPDRVHGSNGMTASLVGFELASPDPRRRYAPDRLQLLYALMFSFGGIPLIYMGDEIAQTNACDPATQALITEDGRWLQRPLWQAGVRADAATLAGVGLRALAQARAANSDLDAFALRTLVPEAIAPCADGLFAFYRGTKTLCVFNFSDHERTLDLAKTAPQVRFKNALTDAIVDSTLMLTPWSFAWLQSTTPIQKK